MSKINSVCILILLTWIQAFPQLSGTLTIGGTSPDYASFNAAVTDLVANGVGGPVVFEIRPGTYPEQVTLPSISGASSTNTITFESSNGHSEDVILTYSPVDGPGNFTLKLDGASYCRFRNMTIQTTGSTYARVIILKGYYNKFIGNRLIGIRVSSDSDLFCLVDSYFNTDSYNEFTGNEFLYGSYGLYLSNATVHEQGTVIEDNLFTDQYASAIWTINQDNATITGNIISTNSLYAGYIGIRCYRFQITYEIAGNQVIMPSGMGGYGMYLVVFSGTGKVYNNMVLINTTGGNCNGIYISSCTSLELYYNTVRITGSSASSRAMYYYNSNTNTTLQNNILVNDAGGYAIYCNESSGLSSDYNDLLTNGSYLAYWSGNQADLSAWQLASGLDPNSISIDPVFYSGNDLHTANTDLQNGTPVAGILQDIDGDTRDGTDPCIGADEFIYPALGGTYSIGPAGSDYTNITDAVTAMQNGGIRDHVVFEIADGTYNEQINLSSISGESEDRTILFRSASKDSTKVIITYGPTGSLENYTVRIPGTNYVKFHQLTITTSGTTYGLVVDIRGAASNITFSNNRLIGSQSATGLDGMVMSGYEYVGRDIHIFNNHFQYGTYGINFYGADCYWVRIERNLFSDLTFRCISLNTMFSPVVRENRMESELAIPFYGFYCFDIRDSVVIEKNWMSYPNSTEGTGIYLRRCDGLASKYVKIHNNYIRYKTGGSLPYGIYCRESDYNEIYNNTIILTGAAVLSRTVFLESTNSNIRIKNNIFSNSADGYSIFSELTTGIESDYNDLYTTGSNLGYWNSLNRPDLPAWQSASGMDANSLSTDPRITAQSGPHFPDLLLNDAGTPLTAVPDDIDGEMRDPANPDIGADEFCLPPVAADKQGCTTRTIPPLTATGTGTINWYADRELTQHLASGNSYASGDDTEGTYKYYVTQTINESESRPDSATLTINPTPGIPPASDDVICDYDQTPDFTAAGTDLRWYSDPELTNQVGSGTNYESGVSGAGTYRFYVTQTMNGCVSDADTGTLVINPQPSAPAGDISISCFGENVPDLYVDGSNVLWYSDEGLTNQVHSGNTYSTGDTLASDYIYYVTQTVLGCVSETGKDTLRIKERPSAPVAPDQDVCHQETVPPLSATGTDINWYADAGRTIHLFAGSDFDTEKTDVGIYSYYVTQTVNGCESLNEEVTLAINAMPVPSVHTDETVCEAGIQTWELGSTALTGHSYLWTSSMGDLGSTEANPSVTPAVPGTYEYYLTETIDSSGCQEMDTVSITINPDPPLLTIAASGDTTFCLGNNVLLSVTDIPGINYTWKQDGNTVGSNQNTYMANTGGVYSVSLENAHNCTRDSYNSILVTVNDTPSIASIIVEGDLTFCDGDSVNFSVPEVTELTYQWQMDGDNIGTDSNLYTAREPGDYRLITTNQYGCQAITGTQKVIVLETPEDPLITVTGNTNFCEGDSVLLSVPELPGLNYEWRLASGTTTGNFTHQIIVKHTGGYFMKVTNSNDCSAWSKDTIYVTSNPIPENVTISREGPDVFCEGDSCRLFTIQNPLYQYIWKVDGGVIAGATSHEYIVKVQGTYSVQVGNLAECSAESGTQTITVNPVPDAEVINNKEYCIGDAREYSIGGNEVSGNSYSWISRPGEFTSDEANPKVTPTENITYILTETVIATGCHKTDSVIFILNPDPMAKVRNDTSACLSLAGEFQLGYDPVQGNSYSWTSSKGDLSSTDANPVANPASPGIYHYYLTETIDATNCKKTDTVTITIHPEPSISILATVNPFIKGDSTILSASGASEYLWNPAAGLASTTGFQVKASPEGITIYYVEGTSEHGCKDYDSIKLLVYCPVCGQNNSFFEKSGHFDLGCTNTLYQNNLDCSWTILPSGVSNLYLYFPLEDFDILPGDWIWVYNGQDNSADTLGRYNNSKLPAGLIKAGSAMHIRLVTDGSGSGSGFTARWSTDSTVTVNPLTPQQIKIYPNPAEDILFIEWTSAVEENVRISFFNNLGQLVLNREVPVQPGPVREEFSIDYLGVGMYHILLQRGDEIFRYKFMKE